MVVTRYKAVISYDGSQFDGYQIQPSLRTVQGELQRVLTTLNQQDIKVVASGRTDAKVHALKQVIHFDSIREMPLAQYRYTMNKMLPKDIHVLSLEVVDETFHARFQVSKKWYRYLLNMGEYDVFKKNYETQFPRLLDVERMRKAATLFLGEHDYRNFTSTKEDATPTFVRTVESFQIVQEGEHLIFDVMGDGFMRYMVRMMVGTLLKIGEHKKDESEITSRLDNVNDLPCPYKAPGEGLYLMEVFCEKDV